MSRHGFVFALALLLSTTAWTRSNSQEIPHFDLDMSSSEYSILLAERATMMDGHTDPRIQVILDMGKRNLDWLKFINDHRDSSHKISLSSAATQMGFPLDQPRVYNPDIIDKAYRDLLTKVPDSIKAVVLGTMPMSINPPVPDDEFIVWGLKLDRSYQIAARWTLMEGFLPQLAARKSEDVRGYFFLSSNPQIKSVLENWSKLDPRSKVIYTEYLTEVCLNNNISSSTCATNVAGAIANNKVYDLYIKYLPAAAQLWSSFFELQGFRRDVIWNSAAKETHIPFRDPNNAKVKSYLADNIQDEWKWNGWRLLLDFKTTTGVMPEVQFQPGSTPHVNGIAGNVITMDDNAPLTEYDVQWTIRHEFGHVLGFPDCYVEFYDDKNSVMISYQLDITNLMCSRRGHLQQKHYDELKRAYGSR